MMTHRQTTERGFLLIKIVVVLCIEVSVIMFLDEAATRLQMKMPQPFRSVAVLAIAVAAAYPFTLMVDAARRTLLPDEEEIEELELLPGCDQGNYSQISAVEIARAIAQTSDR
jgi:hypothetical protein